MIASVPDLCTLFTYGDDSSTSYSVIVQTDQLTEFFESDE